LWRDRIPRPRAPRGNNHRAFKASIGNALQQLKDVSRTIVLVEPTIMSLLKLILPTGLWVFQKLVGLLLAFTEQERAT